MAYREIQILMVLLAVFISINYAKPPQKIKNGEKASKHDFPYQVVLTGLGYVCTGAIIDTMDILTAAHCFYGGGKSRTPDNAWTVITGSDDWKSRSAEDTFAVDSVILHPKFKMTGLHKHDIAIVKLKRQISFDATKRSVVLSNESYIASGSEVEFTGWGMLSNDYVFMHPSLYKFKANVISVTACRAWLPYLIIAGDRMCTFSKTGATVCSGDSGGPLMFNGELVGIAAEGSCDGELPAIFTRVSPYLEWIRENI